MSFVLIGYLSLLTAIAVQHRRAARIAEENTDLIRCLGGEEVAPSHHTPMRWLHGAWLVSCAIEAIWRDVSPPLGSLVVGMLGLMLGQGLRIAAMRALGPRWTTRIVVLRGLPPITVGIYRWIRHPYYLGLILEIASLPLIFGGALTALVFSLLNLILLLAVRIPAEEAALIRVNDYSAHFKNRGRFMPQKSYR